MGVERFEDGAEEPTQNADTGPPKDTGSPGDAGDPGDADRSGEPAQPRDVDRPEEPAPDKPPRESPEGADVEEKRAESRTRSEYADHLAPPGSPPIEGDSHKGSAEESTHREDAHFEETTAEQEPSGGPSEEQGQTEGRPPADPAKQSLSLDDPSADPADADDSDSGKLDDEQLRAPKPITGLDSETDVPVADHTSLTEERHLSDAVHGEGESEDSPELPDKADYSDHISDYIQDDDQPYPLTNQEWTEHLDEVRAGLDKAREAGLRTIQLHTIDGKGQIWSEERSLLHDSLIQDLYANAANVPCDFKAIVAGGLGGAGKTTVLTEHAGIDTTQYLMINPDNFKEEMARRGMLPEIEGLSPMEASDLAHEESSYLAKRLARRAEAEGKNLIWDITMASQDSTEDRITKLHEAGYARVDGIFVDIPIEISVQRTESRHREGYENYRAGAGLGGRFVPPEVIRSQGDEDWSSQNRRTYEAVKVHFSSWAIYDNSVEDRPARLIDSSNKTHEP